MIRVGLARTRASYQGLRAPWHPGHVYPELAALLGETATQGDANPAYAAVRAALAALGLDAARFGTPEWNPLGGLAPQGGCVVLKPNFIRHWNPQAGQSVESVITHGAVIRAALDYAALAVGPSGSVVLAEAPQQDCDWESVSRLAGLPEMLQLYGDALGRDFRAIDLRREAVQTADGVIVARKPLPGDPLGYRAVDLGRTSFFEGSGLDPNAMRGADYDPAVTGEQHRAGRNAYLLSETVLRADLVVNLPKLKTHKKTGVTLALKNLVGINGDKNWLPHHTVGREGDEFPGGAWIDRLRSRAVEHARGLLAKGRAVGAIRALRRAENAARGDAFIRSGNWHGNRTTWRMVCDLNRAFYYSDASKLRLDAPQPVRRVLTVLDGIVAGEGEGPLAPTDRPLGAILAAEDPIALDLAALALMGFDWERVPKVRELMASAEPRITRVREPNDVRVFEAVTDRPTLRELGPDEVPCDGPFTAHSGWRGHIEKVGAR
ncbi:MAG TPA: DUF362 domain-containing protein [Myxococcota bacterium]|nr:DUF362 domain-containing protein [Myxococcota bacterium]